MNSMKNNNLAKHRAGPVYWDVLLLYPQHLDLLLVVSITFYDVDKLWYMQLALAQPPLTPGGQESVIGLASPQQPVWHGWTQFSPHSWRTESVFGVASPPQPPWHRWTQFSPHSWMTGVCLWCGLSSTACLAWLDPVQSPLLDDRSLSLVWPLLHSLSGMVGPSSVPTPGALV
jgi:hypothetical protein